VGNLVSGADPAVLMRWLYAKVTTKIELSFTPYLDEERLTASGEIIE